MTALTASILLLALQCTTTGETFQTLAAKVGKAHPSWSAERLEREVNAAAEACYKGDHKTEAEVIAGLLTEQAAPAPGKQCSAQTKAGKQCSRTAKAGLLTCWQHIPKPTTEPKKGTEK